MFLVVFREVFCCITYFIRFKPFNGKIRKLFFGIGNKRLMISNNSFILQNLSLNCIVDITTSTVILSLPMQSHEEIRVSWHALIPLV